MNQHARLHHCRGRSNSRKNPRELLNILLLMGFDHTPEDYRTCCKAFDGFWALLRSSKFLLLQTPPSASSSSHRQLSKSKTSPLPISDRPNRVARPQLLVHHHRFKFFASICIRRYRNLTIACCHWQHREEPRDLGDYNSDTLLLSTSKQSAAAHSPCLKASSALL